MRQTYWLLRLRLDWLTGRALRDIARREGVPVSRLYTVISQKPSEMKDESTIYVECSTRRHFVSVLSPSRSDVG